jgi:hypothetical protein
MKPCEMEGIPVTAVEKKAESSVDKLLRAQVMFNRDLPAQELFVGENESTLLLHTKEVQTRCAGLNAGAAWNVALKELWNGKAEELAGDIHTYVPTCFTVFTTSLMT